MTVLNFGDSGISSINEKTIAGCTNLQTVNIGRMISVADGTFSNCRNLTAIIAHADNAKYTASNTGTGNTNGVLFTTTSSANDTLVACPPGKTGQFNVPETTAFIGKYAFRNARVSSINLNKVTSIGENAFGSCTNLTSFSVATTGVTYVAFSIQDGVLYDSLKAELIAYPAGKNSPFPLTAWPEATEKVGDYAFFGATLETVAIPAKVQVLGKGAFGESRLTRVTFDGTIPKTNANWPNSDPADPVFPGDLYDKFYDQNQTNGAKGTYTRTNANATAWTRQP
jgi:hypothetical protein